MSETVRGMRREDAQSLRLNLKRSPRNQITDVMRASIRTLNQTNCQICTSSVELKPDRSRIHR